MLTKDEADVLRGLKDSVVAVGDDGLIAYASPEALALLQRDASLLGQPLTTIIPARLRARHHAGFSQYVRTGASHLQGSTVRVPAVCGNGTETEIDLTIRVFKRPDGTKLVAAGLSLAPLGRAPPGLVRLEKELVRRLYALV